MTAMDLLDIPKDFTINPTEIKYEFLDHTADVQIHAWGCDLKEGFEQCAIGMFDIITDLKSVDFNQYIDIEINGGDDELSLLFRFLDEILFLFNAEPFFVSKAIQITEMDLNEFRIKCRCYGEVFDLDKHPQGTEIKAITYSNMQINHNQNSNRIDLYVIVDI
ncbi:Protein archease-like [Sarcoptes scabiei]|uniref:Protein archease-like n=1 Tax=Sarcoptes scabiei TaxID=52283 RepID=A0A834VEE0_SARSC|nr:Protein archease-like [Sarcoptes scabiei]UXI21738.1 Ion transport peptide-like protein [Sarcoptes scabiei]